MTGPKLIDNIHNTNNNQIVKIKEKINEGNKVIVGVINNNGLNKTERKINKTTDRTHINCMYTNTRSLMNNNKRDELRLLLKDKSVDLLGITESWAHDGIDDSELNFDGYAMFRKDRKNPLKERGGGVIGT